MPWHKPYLQLVATVKCEGWIGFSAGVSLPESDPPLSAFLLHLRRSAVLGLLEPAMQPARQTRTTELIPKEKSKGKEESGYHALPPFMRSAMQRTHIFGTSLGTYGLNMISRPQSQQVPVSLSSKGEGPFGIQTTKSGFFSIGWTFPFLRAGDALAYTSYFFGSILSVCASLSRMAFSAGSISPSLSEMSSAVT